MWRPRVRIAIENIDKVEEEAKDASLKTKGTKRKRAPPTKGPCEHGVKYRSNCKVCSACPHGRRRSQCKESAVGHKYASTVVSALHASSAAGLEYVSTVVSALSARSAVGLKSASTVVSAIHARSAAGLESASTVVGAVSARSVVGHKYASTVVSAIDARSAVGLESASTIVSALSARSAKNSTREVLD